MESLLAKTCLFLETELNMLVEVTACHKGPRSGDEVSLRFFPFLHPYRLLSTHCFNPKSNPN